MMAMNSGLPSSAGIFSPRDIFHEDVQHPGISKRSSSSDGI